jgi:hypothetical protein
VAAAVATHRECVLGPACPITHKRGLVQNIVAGAFQALTIARIQDGMQIPNIIVSEHIPSVARHHCLAIKLSDVPGPLGLGLRAQPTKSAFPQCSCPRTSDLGPV